MNSIPETIRLWISAGELSGDQRGAEFLRAAPALPTIQAHGIAGPHLAAAGVKPLVDLDALQVFGVVEALAAIPRSLAILTRAVRHARRLQPDLAVLVDYGEFHMRLGNRLRKLGIPVFHLAPPKLWAWGGWRVRRLRRSADAVGVLFPFEVPFYEQRGLPAVCVGHPAATPGVPAAAPDKLLLLPGSRPAELARHTALMLAASEKPAQQLGLARVLGLAAGQHLPKNLALPSDVTLRPITSAANFADGALALAASGTVNIELAALGMPHVVCYRTSPGTFAAGRLLVRTPWINPVNISANKPIVEELLQDDATPAALSAALLRTWQRQDELRQKLHAVAAELHRPKGMTDAWTLCHSLIR